MIQTTLTQEETDTLVKYTEKFNTIVAQAKEQKMKAFIKEQATSVKHFKLAKKSEDTSALDAVKVEPTLTSLVEIFVAFGSDITIAVKEELLEIAPFKGVDEETLEAVTQLATDFDENYFPFLTLDLLASIRKTLVEVEDKSPLSLALTSLDEQISQHYLEVNSGSKLYTKIHTLSLKLITIDMLILEDDLVGSQVPKIKRLEKKYQKKYESLLSEAKKYDILVQNLQYIKAS
ncbi:hypothetical protein JHD49_01520 [Sulfurimonas sp. SAG-AH-194-C21]|nr:hypothetical protein [Sulfurimonas sp. SAG-AH-194-C21]MDF1882614.1 hypothetical protein [Sulfurimonas sp. SAG-AH-194-C21]